MDSGRKKFHAELAEIAETVQNKIVFFAGLCDLRNEILPGLCALAGEILDQKSDC